MSRKKERSNLKYHDKRFAEEVVFQILHNLANNKDALCEAIKICKEENLERILLEKVEKTIKNLEKEDRIKTQDRLRRMAQMIIFKKKYPELLGSKALYYDYFGCIEVVITNLALDCVKIERIRNRNNSFWADPRRIKVCG